MSNLTYSCEVATVRLMSLSLLDEESDANIHQHKSLTELQKNRQKEGFCRESSTNSSKRQNPHNKRASNPIRSHCTLFNTHAHVKSNKYVNNLSSRSKNPQVMEETWKPPN
ncbi:hypothetical protein ACTXT7_013570 [Hymenolepis weldensis]